MQNKRYTGITSIMYGKHFLVQLLKMLLYSLQQMLLNQLNQKQQFHQKQLV
ncbi:major capsid protein [Bacillus phage SerPounce]|uniref:Major capsid protein n=1 Tax=Bacillus phage SerPounce TaxID=1983413 RepID=A0A1X9SHM9_9CAUD|nr:major capsid protein [Bacillus phage SerPounce]ARQ95579.1 major capsid protein [Bacillus phage SerPounce]